MVASSQNQKNMKERRCAIHTSIDVSGHSEIAIGELGTSVYIDGKIPVSADHGSLAPRLSKYLHNGINGAKCNERWSVRRGISMTEM